MDAIFFGTVIALPVLVTFAYAGVRGAPWVPTHSTDVDRFLRLAKLQPGERFYDLGCGDGRLIRAAARAGATATGFECSILPYCLAKFRRGGKVLFRDFWNADLSDASVVYCFLMPKAYPRLKTKLERECWPGTRVILYVWPMEGWDAQCIDEQEGQPKLHMYTL